MKVAFRIAACVVCLVVLASTVCLAESRVTKESELPAFVGSPFRPRISGDWVVTVQNQDDKACASSSIGVIIYNVVTKQAYTVFTGLAGWCSIGGNLAVWTGKTDNIQGFCSLKGDRSGSRIPANLILVDVRDWKYYIPPINTGPAFAPVVAGDFVAYEGKGGQICLLNLRTSEEKIISSGTERHGNPQIAADLVVWEEYTDKRQIRGYRISTGETINITDDAGAEHCGPYTDGKTVVWWGNGEGVGAYDLATGKRTKVSKTGFYAGVDNGIVVYLKSEGKDSAVYGYDLAKSEEFRISSGKADCGPAISNGRVIWCLGKKIICVQLK